MLPPGIYQARAQLALPEHLVKFLSLPEGDFEVIAFRFDESPHEPGFYWLLEHEVDFPLALARSGAYSPCEEEGVPGGETDFAMTVLRHAFPSYGQDLKWVRPWRGGRANNHFFAPAPGARRSFHFWFRP